MLEFFIFGGIVIALILLLIVPYITDLWFLKSKQELQTNKLHAIHKALVDCEVELRLRSLALDYGVERGNLCGKCFNARIADDDDLTDENDFSSCAIGSFSDGYSVWLNSGNGRPVEIEFCRWSEERQQQETVAIYRPKFCPECGRRLNEYEKGED